MGQFNRQLVIISLFAAAAAVGNCIDCFAASTDSIARVIYESYRVETLFPLLNGQNRSLLGGLVSNSARKAKDSIRFWELRKENICTSTPVLESDTNRLTNLDFAQSPVTAQALSFLFGAAVFEPTSVRRISVHVTNAEISTLPSNELYTKIQETKRLCPERTRVPSSVSVVNTVVVGNISIEIEFTSEATVAEFERQRKEFEKLYTNEQFKIIAVKGEILKIVSKTPVILGIRVEPAEGML